MIIYKQRGVSVGEVWFDAGLAPVSGADVICIRRSSEAIAGRRNYESDTLLSDLSMSTDSLLNCISKETRYEIRRAETKDDVNCKFLTQPSLVDYEAFAEFYKTFASQKGMPDLTALMHSISRSYLASGKLTLTCALRASEPLIWHSYFVQGTRCRLLNSASHFRAASDSAFRSLVGRVNRWLHWNDMLLFKQQGVCAYDWGGWATGDDPILVKINQFKEGFGGVPAKVYDARYGITLPGKIENAALQVVQQWRMRSRRVDLQKPEAKETKVQ